DFEVVNETGSASDPVGKALGLRAAVRNFANAHLEEAVALEAQIENSGTVTDAYGLRLANVDQGSNLNYAIHTGAGTAHFGDDLELLVQPSTPVDNPPTGFLKLYPKAAVGQPIFYIKDATGTEQELSVSGRIAVTDDTTTVDPALALD